MEYSDAFRRKMVQRMLGPQAKSATALSREVGIHQATLSRWLRQASSPTLNEMPLTKSPNERVGKPVRSAQERCRIVLAVEAAPPDQVGALLRREGVHEAEVAQWREALTVAFEDGKLEAATGKGAVQSKRIRFLERELKRKDKALAEAAALLVLQKKVRALWADEDDDTTETNEP